MRVDPLVGHRYVLVQRLRATLGHALSFYTWRSLERKQKIMRDDAIELMVGLGQKAAEV